MVRKIVLILFSILCLSMPSFAQPEIDPVLIDIFNNELTRLGENSSNEERLSRLVYEILTEEDLLKVRQLKHNGRNDFEGVLYSLKGIEY